MKQFKVIYTAQVKRVPVLIADGTMDSNGQSHPPDSTITFPATLPVVRDLRMSDQDSWLGSARIFREGNTFYADLELTLDKISEEVLKLLFPGVYGHSAGHHVDGSIQECSIDGISLTAAPNSDSRIKRLGDHHD